MNLIINEKDGIDIVEIEGKLDGITSEEVQEKILPLITENKKFVFVMSKCTYVSSAGLRVLLVIAKQMKNVNAKGVLCGLIEEVKDVMEMTGFDHIFNSYDSLEEALKMIKV